MRDPEPLREALIKAGISLLEEGGAAALSLRRVAARAGVSHAAPAQHFAGLPGLWTAIAARAFQDFAQSLQRQVDAAPPDPRARLEATCQGYLDFAATHPGLFHIMFVSPEVNRADAGIAPHSARAYQILRDACLPFSSTSAPDPVLEIAVWSMAHGYATLRLHARPAGRPMPQAPAFAACLAALLDERTRGPLASQDEMR